MLICSMSLEGLNWLPGGCRYLGLFVEVAVLVNAGRKTWGRGLNLYHAYFTARKRTRCSQQCIEDGGVLLASLRGCCIPVRESVLRRTLPPKTSFACVPGQMLSVRGRRGPWIDIRPGMGA